MFEITPMHHSQKWMSWCDICSEWLWVQWTRKDDGDELLGRFFRIDSCTVHCVENWNCQLFYDSWPLLVNGLRQCLLSEWKLTVCSRAMFPSKHLHSWCHSALSFCINTHAFHNTVKSCTCKSSPSPLKKHVAFKRFFVKRLINSPCIIFVTTFWNVKNLWNSN